MTDRIKGFTVYLDSLDIRDDAPIIENLQTAFKSFKHVHSVKPFLVTSADHFAYEKGYHDAMMKIYDFLAKERKF